MTIDKAKLRKLCDKATPGPWHWGFHDESVLFVYGRRGDYDHVLWAEICPACRERKGRCTAPKDDDADFIAASREALPGLLDDHDRLEAEVAALEARVKDSMNEGQASTVAELVATRTQRDELKAEVERLRQALAPFAKIAALMDHYVEESFPGEEELTFPQWSTKMDDYGPERVVLEPQDFYAAAKALQEPNR